jgi:hypothetical protein
MSEATQQARIEVSNQLPQGTTLPAAGDNKAITIVNDTGTDVMIAINNGFLGLASCGYVKAGSTQALPAGWAWWDVFALFQNSTGFTFIDWSGAAIYTINFHRKQSMVGQGGTVKVSQMPA